jgi:hypothetical protein
MLRHENFQSILSSKTTDWSHVLNIIHFPCNCILFTKFNTKVLYKHFFIITLFHYQIILRHVQPHLLANKSGRNMSANYLIMKKCLCSKLVLNFIQNNQLDASNIQNLLCHERVSWQNKFWIFDASSWLFYPKLIMMHGHLNMKLVLDFCYSVSCNVALLPISCLTSWVLPLNCPSHTTHSFFLASSQGYL